MFEWPQFVFKSKEPSNHLISSRLISSHFISIMDGLFFRKMSDISQISWQKWGHGARLAGRNLLLDCFTGHECGQLGLAQKLGCPPWSHWGPAWVDPGGWILIRRCLKLDCLGREAWIFGRLLMPEFWLAFFIIFPYFSNFHKVFLTPWPCHSRWGAGLHVANCSTNIAPRHLVTTVRDDLLWPSVGKGISASSWFLKLLSFPVVCSKWGICGGSSVIKWRIFLTPSISGGHTQMGSLGSNRAKPVEAWYGTHTVARSILLSMYMCLAQGLNIAGPLLDAIGCYCWHGKTTKL